MLTVRWMFFLFFCLPGFLGAQGLGAERVIRCDHYAASDGLVDDAVWSMVQDEAGTLWIGTQQGLVRYDGVEMEMMDLVFEGPAPFPDRACINVRTLAIGPRGGLWIVTPYRSLYRFDRQTRRFSVIRAGPNAGHGLFQGIPRAIQFDKAGALWVGTTNGGLFRVVFSGWDAGNALPQIDTLIQYRRSLGNFPAGETTYLALDREGSVWMATDRGLAKWSYSRDTFLFYQPVPDTAYREANDLHVIAAGAEGNIWISAGGGKYGLYHFHTASQTFTHFSAENSTLPSNDIKRLFHDSQKRLWINYYDGREDRLAWLHTRTGRMEPLAVRLRSPATGLFNLSLRTFLEDPAGNIWMGAHNGGLTKYSPCQSVFQWIGARARYGGEWQARPVGKIVVDGRDHVWMIDDRGIMPLWNTRLQQPLRDSILSRVADRISVLSASSGMTKTRRGAIWMWSEEGLFRKAPQRNHVEQIDALDASLRRLVVRGIQGFTEDQEGWWWILTHQEMHRYDPHSQQLISVLRMADLGPQYRNSLFSELYMDLSGILWAGTANDGFFRYDPSNDSLRHYAYSPGRSFVEDQRGYLYVGTYSNGLVRVDLETLESKAITTENGLPSNKIRGGLAVDKNGLLWIGSNQGLACYDPDREQIKLYTVADGLPSNHFTSVQAGITSGGALVFGTLYGAVMFHPDSLKVDSRPPRVQLQELAIQGQIIAPGEDGPLASSLAFTDHLRLRHSQNDLTIRFAALHFKNPAKNTYAVQLAPYQSEWRPIGAQRSATYTNLSPGRYTFRVKAANSDGVWTQEARTLSITILPPWWATRWAYALYILLVAAILYALYRFQLNRRLAKVEQQRLRELDTFKSRFYTNITHEFRTPLTVILGMADRVMEDPQRWFREGLGMIRRNGRQLLDLVNQLLDLSKIESGAMALDLAYRDLIPFLNYQLQAHQSVAEHKGIRLHFQSERDQFFTHFDAGKLQTVVSNLLSNALKFTPPEGVVTLSLEAAGKGGVKVVVSDTGIGVPEAERERIFDRFYQVDNTHTRKGEGTGIGLALARELVRLMRGTIAVDGREGEGAAFRLWLPLNEEAGAPVADENPEFAEVAVAVAGAEPPPQAPPSDDHGGVEDVPLALLIEDNPDVVRYLESCLAGQYRLKAAYDGQAGIESALELIPDIIICDVMMPKKGGFTVCRTLKQDERSSHIPIILLTAKADEASRLEGLEGGADAYLTKPFQPAELEVRLRKLIEIRRNLRERYGALQPSAPAADAREAREDAFMQRFRETLALHLEEEDFGIGELCRELGVGRSQLHRKLKALTGLSASHAIRQIRLEHARRLLQREELRVGEVARRSGFRDPGYFSRVYREFFGRAPSEDRG